MPKEKVNYQEVYDLYQLCSETKDLKEFCSEYGVNYDKFMDSNWNLRYSAIPIVVRAGFIPVLTLERKKSHAENFHLKTLPISFI